MVLEPADASMLAQEVKVVVKSGGLGDAHPGGKQLEPARVGCI